MGHAAVMSCCWEENSSYTRLRLTWNKNSNKTVIDTRLVTNQNETNHSNHSDYYKFEISSNCYWLTILRVTSKDVDLYTCEIKGEIPLLKKFAGQGTHLSIQADDEIKGVYRNIFLKLHDLQRSFFHKQLYDHVLFS